MSTDKGTYNKFDGSKKPSFNKFSKDGNSTGSFKRKFDGDNKSGFDNKRFKDNKFGSKDKKPVALDKKARLELRKQRRAAKPNAGTFLFPFLNQVQYTFPLQHSKIYYSQHFYYQQYGYNPRYPSLFSKRKVIKNIAIYLILLFIRAHKRIITK